MGQFLIALYFILELTCNVSFAFCKRHKFGARIEIDIIFFSILCARCVSVRSATNSNTLLKSDVTSRDHVVRCRGSQECGSRFVNFACQFHWQWHSLRITLNIVVHAQ